MKSRNKTTSLNFEALEQRLVLDAGLLGGSVLAKLDYAFQRVERIIERYEIPIESKLNSIQERVSHYLPKDVASISSVVKESVEEAEMIIDEIQSKTTLPKVVESVQEKVEDAIKEATNVVEEKVSNLPDSSAVKEIIEDATNQAKQAVESAVESAKKDLPEAGDVKEIVEKAVEQTEQKVEEAIKKIPTSIENVVEVVEKQVEEVADIVMKQIGDIPSSVEDKVEKQLHAAKEVVDKALDRVDMSLGEMAAIAYANGDTDEVTDLLASLRRSFLSSY